MFQEKIKIFLSVFIIVSSFSFAQNKKDSTHISSYNLDTLVVTANRYESTLSTAPTKVELLDSKKIEAGTGRRLSDALELSPYVTIRSYGGASGLQNIVMNGLSASHVLILVDGVRLNSFQNSQFDLSLIPKEIIERIEIINNGASSLYGSNAVGGLVNIITKQDMADTQGKNIGAEVSMSIGSYNTNIYSLKLSNQIGSLKSNIFYSSEKSDGNYEYYFHHGDNTEKKERENASYELHEAGINLSYITSKNSWISFLSTYNDHDKNIAGIETGNKQPKTTQRDRNWNNILKFENRFSENSDLVISLNYQNNLMDYKTPPLTDDQYKNLVYSASALYNYKFGIHRINAAYDFSHAYLISNQVDGNPLRNKHGLSTSIEIGLPFNTKIYPSIRWESISDLDTNVVIGKIGFNSAPFKNIDLHIRGNVGTNFLSPSFNDLYWRLQGNKDLKPESSTNFEGGLLFYFNEAKNISIDFSYVYIEAKDKIMWSPITPMIWAPQNIASSESRITSITLASQLIQTDKLTIRSDMGVVFNSSKKTSKSYEGDKTYNKQMIYVPETTFKANLLMDFWNINLGIFYSFMDTRFIDMANNNPLPAHHLVNASISYSFPIWKLNTQLKFETKNLSDTDYQLVSGYPMPLKNYLLKLIINY